MFGIKTVTAKYQIDLMSESIKRSLQEKVENGGYPRSAPFGYLNAGQKQPIIPDPQLSPIVKEIFELFATGKYSLLSLRNELKRRGLFIGQSKYKISKSNIHKMLKNKVYCGYVPFKGTIYSGNHKAIIEESLFDQVQDVLNGRSRPTRVNTYRYTYSGFLICGECGHSITAEKKKNRYVYYRCTHARYGCTNTRSHIQEDVFDDQFYDLLATLKVNPDQWQSIQDRLRSQFKSDDIGKEKQRQQLQSELDRLYVKIDQGLDQKLAGNISEQAWISLTQKWNDNSETITNALNELNQLPQPFYQNIDRLKLLLKKAPKLYLNQPDSEKRRLLMVLLKPKCKLTDKTVDFKLFGIDQE